MSKIQPQTQTGQNLYDDWVNDSDLIGTHWYYQKLRNLTDFMANESRDFTNPGLGFKDFIGSAFATALERSSINFLTSNSLTSTGSSTTGSAPRNKTYFKAKYSDDLGVPVN